LPVARIVGFEAFARDVVSSRSAHCRYNAAMDTLPDDFILTLPAYSYLIEPGPQPGYLRDPGSGTIFVPIWTDSDLFLSYLERGGLAGKVSGLEITSKAELIAYLRTIPDRIEHVAIDPGAKAPQKITAWKIRELIEELEG
jgi:hypothetical protein